MRLPLLALIVAATAAPLSAQTGTLAHPPESNSTPASRPQPRPSGRYYDDRYVYPPPRISMDSAARAVEQQYEGWHVNSKQLAYEHRDPIYIFAMIASGEIYSRKVVVDADTGEVLNPEVMAAPSDTTTFWREHRRIRYRTRTYP